MDTLIYQLTHYINSLFNLKSIDFHCPTSPELHLLHNRIISQFHTDLNVYLVNQLYFHCILLKNHSKLLEHHLKLPNLCSDTQSLQSYLNTIKINQHKRSLMGLQKENISKEYLFESMQIQSLFPIKDTTSAPHKQLIKADVQEEHNEEYKAAITKELEIQQWRVKRFKLDKNEEIIVDAPLSIIMESKENSEKTEIKKKVEISFDDSLQFSAKNHDSYKEIHLQNSDSLLTTIYYRDIATCFHYLDNLDFVNKLVQSFQKCTEMIFNYHNTTSDLPFGGLISFDPFTIQIKSKFPLFSEFKVLQQYANVLTTLNSIDYSHIKDRLALKSNQSNLILGLEMCLYPIIQCCYTSSFYNSDAVIFQTSELCSLVIKKVISICFSKLETFLSNSSKRIPFDISLYSLEDIQFIKCPKAVIFTEQWLDLWQTWSLSN